MRGIALVVLAAILVVAFVILPPAVVMSSGECDTTRVENKLGVTDQLLLGYEETSNWYATTEEYPLAHDYVIITTNATVDGSGKLSSFIAHKESLGHSALVVTEDDFGAVTGQAPDHRAEKIRQWLKDNHAAMGIEYVLLIGDPHPYESGEGDIPMKMCWPRWRAESNRESPTDYFYADLTGNWDLDGDLYYGEWGDDYGPIQGVDFTPEVYVGRIPVYASDYITLDRILQKTIDYETESVEFGDSDDIGWRQSILLPMGFLSPGYDGAVLAEQMKDDYLDPAGFMSWRMYQQGTAYPSYGDSIYSSEEELRGNTPVVASRWAEADFGVVCWWGHGVPASTYVGYDGYWDGMLFSSDHCSYLDDDRPSFTYQCCCSNGRPETINNLQYSILKQGGIATVGPTRRCWFSSVPYGGFDGSPTAGGIGYEYVQRLVRGLPAGDALFLAKQSMPPETREYLMNWYSFNLYGDPETALVSPEQVPDPDIWPNIWVQPPSLDVTLRPDIMWSVSIHIGNAGNGVLTYSIADYQTAAGLPPIHVMVEGANPEYLGQRLLDDTLMIGGAEECPWLDENPKTGEVEPGSYAAITLSIDTTGLAAGEYSAEIRIENSDPDRSIVAIPVRLNVDDMATMMTVTSPNGGEYWVGGSAEEITWTATGTNLGATPISIEYYDGSSWVAVASGEANGGTFPWTVPSLNISDAKIRVIATDLAGNMSSDESDAVFTIDSAPEVSVTNPNGGEHWAGGSLQGITWTATDVNLGATPITIEYYDGSSWLAVATDEPNDGSYIWTVPNLDISNAMIRASATDLGGNTGVGQSDLMFTIDSTPPAEPVIAAGIDEMVTDNTVTLDWSDVSDSSGVVYYLEADDDSDFSSPVLCETDLTDSTYTLISPLADGTYYWRIRAIDSAGNESGWTDGGCFKVDTGVSSPVGLIIGVIVGAVILAGLAYVALHWRRTH